MRVLLKKDNGDTQELKPELLPDGTRAILLRTTMMTKPDDMVRLKKDLTEQVGIKVIVLPAWVREVVVLPDDIAEEVVKQW